MPSPFLRSTTGRPPEFYCSLCKTKLKTRFPHLIPAVLKEWENTLAEAKATILKEWDEHLYSAHPRQWEREQKKRARRRAKVNE
jgi:hypothetical protein